MRTGPKHSTGWTQAREEYDFKFNQFRYVKPLSRHRAEATK